MIIHTLSEKAKLESKHACILTPLQFYSIFFKLMNDAIGMMIKVIVINIFSLHEPSCDVKK